MALAQLRQDATEARITTSDLPQGGWSNAARQEALSRLRQMGLPERRDEYWKFTRPDSLVQPEVPPAALFDPKENMMFHDLDRLKIVFVDGVFDAEASDDLALEGVRVERLADVAGADIHWAKDIYGVLEARGQDPVARPFAAFNTAFASDGLLIHVTGKPTKAISLQYLHQDETSDAVLHHVVRVDAGAEATIWKMVRQRRGSTNAWKSISPMAALCTMSAPRDEIMSAGP